MAKINQIIIIIKWNLTRMRYLCRFNTLKRDKCKREKKKIKRGEEDS